jgi:8-oxo-dGTP diphosphatase
MIEVVSALIVRDGRALLAQNPGREHGLAFLWETPGGKIEKGETAHAALSREIWEELGVSLGEIPTTPIAESVVNVGGREVRVRTFRVIDWDGKPKGYEGQFLGWFTADEIRGLRLMPADHKSRGQLVESVGPPPAA